MRYAANSNIEPLLDLEKDLIEQNISEDSKSILAILWQIYMCE